MPGPYAHGALPPFLRGIPIDWSEGHFIWAREGCECVVKFCPQHCRELIGTASSDHESEDGSTPGPSLRVDESDPYGLSSSNYNLSSPDYGLSSNDDEAAEGPEGSGRHDVDDDHHNGEVDDDADDDEAGSGRSDEAHGDRNEIQSASNEPHNASVQPSIEGAQQSGEGSPTLSASPEKTAQDDPEATISPDNRHHEAEGMGSPSHQDRPDSGNAEALQEFLQALPEELRNEIPIPPASAPPRLPAMSANRPAYQTSRRLAREVRHLTREARPLSQSVSPRPRHHQRRTSGSLATVLNTSPSPAPDSARPSGSSQAVRGGYGSVSGRTPAQQPNQSQTMPPLGFFPASNPKPVARRLFSRADPSQSHQLPQLRPTPAPGTASAHTADKVGEVEEGSNGGEASEVGESSKVGERSGMVTRSQGRRGRAGAGGAGGAVDKVGESSKVGQSSKVGEASGMVTRSQGRRGRAGVEVQDNRDDISQSNRNGQNDEGYQTKEGTQDHQSEQEEEQGIQDGEPTGSNVEGQLEEESSEQDELAAETTAPTRPKRGRPRKSGSTVTYGKKNRGKRRKL